MMNDIQIHGLAAGGNGIGRLEDGCVVFVPRTAPGDRVVVDVVERKKRWVKGRVRSLVVESADRVEPRCVHFVEDRCGGCQWQHVSLEMQRRTKGRIVGDAMRRIAGRAWDDPVVEPADDNWHYRRKITLHCGRDGRIGFHPYDDPSRVFDLRECPIADESLVELWKTLSAVRHLFPPDLSKIVLTVDRDARRHVIAHAFTDWDPAELVETISDADVTVWQRGPKRRLRRLHGPNVEVSPTSFQQANLEMAERIRSWIVETIVHARGGTAWDLYGGVGDTARLLSGRGYEVWTVDVDQPVKAAGVGNPDPGVHWVTAPAEDTVGSLPEPEVVIVNPPRTGMPERLTRMLNAWGERRRNARLGYISCDPATLARDIRRLPAFEITDLRAYDMFPQTSHVETAVALKAEGPR